MKPGSRQRGLAVAATLALFALGAGADGLEMTIRPVFDGYAPSFGTNPLVVLLENQGDDARGELRVSGDGFDVRHLVELPRGARKRLVTYPDARSYFGYQFRLQTNRGSLQREYLASGRGDALSVAVITDHPGDMAFLRGKAPSGGGTGSIALRDVYCRPEDAPERMSGYVGLSAVVMGAGSERIGADAAAGLRLWVLSGGTLVFLGGASAPAARDERWKGLMPVRLAGVATLERSPVLEDLGRVALPGPISVTDAEPIEGASVRRDHRVICAERHYGLGKAVFVAFNPTEAPLSPGWEGRREAMARIIRPGDQNRANAYLAQYVYEGGSAAYYGGASASSPPPPRPVGAAVYAPSEDPFSTELPPTERIFILLGVYFVMVVPVNFLILRKLKRAELAWITAPLLALGFAGTLMASAKDLYSARLSRAAQGVLIIQEGDPEAVFVGRAQMFFPRGGRYDLRLSGVQSLSSADSEDGYSGYARGLSDSFDAIDAGEIVVPAMPVGNLAFRQMHFTQRVRLDRSFDLELTPRRGSSPKQALCRVRNNSDFPLARAAVVSAGKFHPLGTLSAGEEKMLLIDLGLPEARPRNAEPDLRQLVYQQDRLALTGDLLGFHPGPQVGQEVPGRRRITLAFLAAERFREAGR